MGFHYSSQVHLKFKCYKCTSFHITLVIPLCLFDPSTFWAFPLILCRQCKTLFFHKFFCILYKDYTILSCKSIRSKDNIHRALDQPSASFKTPGINHPEKSTPTHPDLLHSTNNLQHSLGDVCISIFISHTSTSPKKSSFHDQIHSVNKKPPNIQQGPKIKSM